MGPSDVLADDYVYVKSLIPLPGRRVRYPPAMDHLVGQVCKVFSRREEWLTVRDPLTNNIWKIEYHNLALPNEQGNNMSRVILKCQQLVKDCAVVDMRLAEQANHILTKLQSKDPVLEDIVQVCKNFVKLVSMYNYDEHDEGDLNYLLDAIKEILADSKKQLAKPVNKVATKVERLSTDPYDPHIVFGPVTTS